METDQLIQSLTGELTPVAPGAAGRRIAAGLGVGALISTALMLTWLGLRPDLAQAVSTPMFWMKFGYAAATGLILAALLTRLAKPAVRPGALAAVALAPLVVVASMALFRFASAPTQMQHALLMGHSWSVCPWRILAIGLPLLAGAVWAVRGLAPTRLLLAGLVSGGCAGGLGAAIYAFACKETSAPFLAIWYTLGMALVAGLGALAGSRLLRWR
ncbi:DUF1109 domain-containing protein [Phenylobacterium sp.]|jgi:hypothetical protein|uniref:DUF1109 domain-containing protein n=1 Tax=Phenylobacterium sp. TaxID=1871053 RepID=UPI002E326164|nr:DUF1109 domain-containing protein [Phenylobacterium sp.]HEX4710853.1 DUF1109 domain-containing protein [Phenylobacterium sp.]